MITRREMKHRGRRVLKKHYLVLVAACLIAAFLGSEFGSSLNGIKAQTANIGYPAEGAFGESEETVRMEVSSREGLWTWCMICWRAGKRTRETWRTD